MIEQISITVTKISNLISNSEFEILDKYLMEFNINTPLPVLIAVLRSTFVWKDKLSHWSILLDMCSQAIANQNKDQNLLYGLK